MFQEPAADERVCVHPMEKHNRSRQCRQHGGVSSVGGKRRTVGCGAELEKNRANAKRANKTPISHGGVQHARSQGQFWGLFIRRLAQKVVRPSVGGFWWWWLQ